MLNFIASFTKYLDRIGSSQHDSNITSLDISSEYIAAFAKHLDRICSTLHDTNIESLDISSADGFLFNCAVNQTVGAIFDEYKA